MTDTLRIRHFDAWRFIAVSLVIQSHLIKYSNLKFLTETYPLLSLLGHFGNLGVMISFFLSGFVICQGLMKEQATTSALSVKAFYLRRAFRILPSLWLYLAVMALLGGLGWVAITPAKIGKSALFLCNMNFSGSCSGFVGHTWSLACQEQFYLIFPLVFMVFGLMVRPKILLMMLSLMTLASLGLCALGSAWLSGYLSWMTFILSGCAAALYWHRLVHTCRGLSVRGWLTALTLLIACIVLLPVAFEQYVRTIIYPPLIGLLILGTPVSHLKVRAFFENSKLAYLGKISFSTYLWQQLATGYHPNLSPWWTVLFVLCVWPLAHLSYQYFERPLIGIAAGWSKAIKQQELFGRSSEFAK